MKKLISLNFVSLARQRYGRVLLHLACLAHDGRWGWHWAGIRREFIH